MKPTKVCPNCGKSYVAGSNRQVWCSPACSTYTRATPCANPACDRTTRAGKNCPRCAARLAYHGAYDLPWREYPQLTSRDGYKRRQVGKHHPMANVQGMCYEHRLVMAEMIGRPLRAGETVHHKNGDRTDNRPENLELWAKNHGAGQRVEDMVADIVARYPKIVARALNQLWIDECTPTASRDQAGS